MIDAVKNKALVSQISEIGAISGKEPLSVFCGYEIQWKSGVHLQSIPNIPFSQKLISALYYDISLIYVVKLRTSEDLLRREGNQIEL